jgi:hypothetical protein
LVEAEQQNPPATISQTTTPQVLKEKRPRQDLSPPVTEVSSEEFQLHTKRPKTISVLGPIGEKEALSTTVTTRPPLGASLQRVITSALPKKYTDSPSTTQTGKVGPKLSIFEKYELIRKRNQTLTSNTCAQFWKQTPTAQHRMLSAFDTEKGRMHMEFL